MPRTQGEKIEEALVIVNTLTVRLDSVNRDLESIIAAHAQTLKSVGEVNTAVVVSKQQIDEFNRWKSDLGPIADLKSEMALLRRDLESLQGRPAMNGAAGSGQWPVLWWVPWSVPLSPPCWGTTMKPALHVAGSTGHGKRCNPPRCLGRG